MAISGFGLGKREPLVLLAGDIFILFVSLWLAVFLRNLADPERDLFFTQHLLPFSILFVAWITVFYIAGLYGKHTVILRSKLAVTLLNTLFVNALIAVVFFYFIGFFGITPKTVLFIYLIISFLALLFWRMRGYFLLGSRRIDNAIIIGSGSEMRELHEEVNRNDIYNIRFVQDIDEASIIIVDFDDDSLKPKLPDLYERIFSKVSFADMHKVYEDIFDRVPLSLLKYNWFLENISTEKRTAYDAMKRLMDVVISFALLLITAPFFPIIALFIKLDSDGPAIIPQERFGQNNRVIRLIKFRSMTGNDKGKWLDKDDDRVTRVGRFLRRSRIDELPQLWNVLKGDISLIGPRPDIYDLGVKLQEEIPYYNVRNIVRPGLSGWAQINQDIVPHSVEETKMRLAYDLYYIKNRSFLLDLQIALRTIKTLASRVGR